jgi:KaiC/GvpD/RAD55 family RecA-like ATPase
VKYSPYVFNRSDAFEFARYIGIQVKERGEELQFRECPYCRQRTTDKNTFAISLRTGQFKCLRSTCNISGNMIKLSQDFGFSLGNEIDEYLKPKKRYRTFKKPEKPIVPKDDAIEYLKSRGIGERVAKLYEITVQNDHPNILVFPFYDEAGELVFVKYRKTDFDKEKDDNKEWCEAGAKPILFGMKQCNPGNKTLIMTEGQIDSLSVAEAGYQNVVSVPTGARGMTWIPHCWDFVNQFETIIVFGDYEKGRITLLDDIKNRFKKHIKHVREEDYKDCKDANEILLKYGKPQIKACITNAVDVPVEHVINLSMVEDINPFEIEKLPTGFKELDQLLYGGLPFGGITLMTGKAGMGKSTVASQIVISAMENGHRCFCYSGELPNHLFKSWMTYQVAGANHIFKYQTRWGDEGYNISDANKKLIDEWYKDKIDIYDSTSIGDDEEVSIIEIITDMISRYLVEVILIDNLMTALDLDATHESDKFERQSKFVKKLNKIAMKYKVLIILVAHKRKNNFSKNANDEVSGSSDISNLASITLSYDKADNQEDNERTLSLSKNRLFGKTGSWIMDYDEKSKRVYGVRDDKDREFGWNVTEWDVNEDAPFN